MAYRRDYSPEGYPVIRAPPMTSGDPPRRPPPPRTVHWDDRPGYTESPPRGRGGRYSEYDRGRYADDSPPQRYLEGPPPGYQDSPPRRFPGRLNPPPAQYLSPEDSPPYRYTEDAPRRYGGGHSRPYSEDEPLPADIDGPPPPEFRGEGPRRFGGGNLGRGGFSGYRNERYPESESPSPPPGYFPPPPPPPGYLDDSPYRYSHSRSPRQFRRYADDDTPARYPDEGPRRFGGVAASQHYYDRSPPGPGYADEPPRRFGGTPPRKFHHDGSPPDEPPRRFAGSPRRYEGSSPPSPPGIGGRAEDTARRYAGGPSRPPPGYGEDTTPPRRFADAPPPRQAPEGSAAPVPVPARGEDPAGRLAGAPPRQSGDGSTSAGGIPVRPGYIEDPARMSAGARPPQFAPSGLPAGPSGYAEDIGRRRPPDGSPPGPPQFPPSGLPAGPLGYAEDIGRRRPPDASPPGPPGYAADAPTRGGFAAPGQRPFPDSSPPGPPGYVGGVPPRQLDGQPPAGALTLGPPRGPPGSYARDEPSPRFPPDVFATGALPGGRRRPPRSADTSPGPPATRYTGRDRLPPRTPDESPPDIYGGPRDRPLGSVSPRYGGGRYEASPDVYGNLPPHATPPRVPREDYRPPPPGLGAGGDAPLLPAGYATPNRQPQRLPPAGVGGLGGSSPDFLFVGLPKRHPDGYRASTPPRQPPPRPPGLGRDEIFTADVVPIELDDNLKTVQPHQGNPGSQTGGGWRDLWAALLFVLQIGGITALSIIFGLQGVANTVQHYNSPNSFHITDWFPQLAAAAIVGAVFACIWQNAIRMYPVVMILVTIWTGSALMILVGIVLIATGKSTGLIGIGFFFAGVCQALYAFVVRDRMPFAGEMLKKVISVCSIYPSTYGVSYTFVLVALGWLALWIFGFSGSGIRPKHAAIMAGFVLNLLWTMQVLRNIVRVTVAGTVALFYFQEHNMPRMATYTSLLRACTSSLGSICFGSFFVPLVEAPCHALRRINSQAGASEFMFSCVVCLLSCFNRLIRYFNRMGYIQVALYGKPFIRASKDTWDMLREQEVDVLVHDDLTSTILFLACGIGGSISALVGGIWTFIAHKSLTIVISVISFLIGTLITYVTTAVVESGVATYYVCFAEDPASLQRHDGPFYERMWVRQMELVSPVTELTE